LIALRDWKDIFDRYPVLDSPAFYAIRASALPLAHLRSETLIASQNAGEIDLTIYSRNSSFASLSVRQPEEDWLIARHSQICADQTNVREVDHLQSGILRFRRRTRLMPATRRISLDRHVGVERYRKRILFGEISCR